jgi:hypothetical protein
MAAVALIVGPGDSLYAIARRLAPNATDAGINTLARAIATGSGYPVGTTLPSIILVPGRILHFDDSILAKLPQKPTLPPPVVDPPPASGAFYTKNGLIGANGLQFVPIGVNGCAHPRGATPGSWWRDGGMGTMTGRAAMYAETNCNFVRLNCWYDSSSGFTMTQFLEGLYDCIDEYVKLGFVVMPAWHGFGPGTNPTVDDMRGDVNFLGWLRGLCLRYRDEHRVWINPINEPWGPFTGQDGPSTALLRNAYYTSMRWVYSEIRTECPDKIIVIDLPHWANLGIQYAEDVWANIGSRNMVLGFHNYDMGDQAVASARLRAAGIPIIMGEAGMTIGGGSRSSCIWSIDSAVTTGWGFVAWWGAGNRNDYFVLGAARGSTWYEAWVGARSEFGAKFFAMASIPRPARAL